MPSTDFGVVHFYYSKTMPADAVGIAAIRAAQVKPSDLCSVNSTALLSGWQGDASLQVVASLTNATVTAPALNVPVSFTGATHYKVDNQFFELTIVVHPATGKPLFYQHVFAATAVTNVSLFDVSRNPISASVLIQNNTLYHSFDGAAYWVEYYVNGQVQTELLRYDATSTRTLSAPSPTTYALTSGGILTVDSSARTFWIRWYQNNGYQLLAPYNVPLNDPWYPRIRFNLKPIAQEWGQMPFLPTRPYLQATWVPGSVLAPNLIQFERERLLWDGQTYPDVLIYDKDYHLKYALDGTVTNTPAEKGYLFPWIRSQFVGLDPRWSRVEVNVPLEPTDICFAFYYYEEKDVVFSGLDVNPFVNPALKNKTVEFYFAQRADTPFQNIFYHVLNQDGTAYTNPSGYPVTNDPDLGTLGVGEIFGALVVGWAVGPDDFTFSDIRVRGGGLADNYQSIPQAANMWDLGYWDGRPYPTGGALPVYLPATLLSTMNRAEVAAKLASLVPAAVLPLIRYYDPATGEETL